MLVLTLIATFQCTAIVSPAGATDGCQVRDFSNVDGLFVGITAEHIVDEELVRLTQVPPGGFDVGTLFTLDAVDITAFSTHFVFRIAEPGGTPSGCDDEPGGDGLAFVIQNHLPQAFGPDGGNLGYHGIPNAVAVEMDAFCNTVNNDPSSNHVGITIGGNVDHGPGAMHTADVSPQFESVDAWYAWVDYDGATLELRLDTVNQRPVEPTLSRPLDVPALVESETAFIGFTAATKGSWDRHEILEWSFDAAVDCRADLDADDQVGINDLLVVLGAWSDSNGPADVNCDGTIDVLDLLALLGEWGQCA